MAQATPQTGPAGATKQAPSQKPNIVNSNPSCQRIIAECKKLGFVQGDWKTDNGIWKDCFDPVVHGGKSQATRDGKPIQVPVSQSDLDNCRSAVKQYEESQQPKQ